MKSKTKRILSVVCALVMCVTLLPTSISALAASEPETPASTEAVVTDESTAAVEDETTEAGNVETTAPAESETGAEGESKPEETTTAGTEETSAPAQEETSTADPQETTTAAETEEESTPAANDGIANINDGESAAETVSNNESKTLYVDDDGADESTYTTIQAAINYISGQDDPTGWTITVSAGTYDRFVVLSGLDGLTIQAAEGELVVVNTLNGSVPADVPFNSGNWMDLGGIQLWAADGVTLEGLEIIVVDDDANTHHMAAAVSNHNEAGEYADNFTIRNCNFVGTGDMSGQGNGNVAVSISKFSSFTIGNTEP